MTSTAGETSPASPDLPGFPDYTAFRERVARMTQREATALGRTLAWEAEGDGDALAESGDRLCRGRVALHSYLHGPSIAGEARDAALEVGRAFERMDWGDRRLSQYLRDLGRFYVVPRRDRAGMQDIEDPWQRTVLRRPNLRDVRWYDLAFIAVAIVCALNGLVLPAVAMVAIFGLLVVFSVAPFV